MEENDELAVAATGVMGRVLRTVSMATGLVADGRKLQDTTT